MAASARPDSCSTSFAWAMSSASSVIAASRTWAWTSTSWAGSRPSPTRRRSETRTAPSECRRSISRQRCQPTTPRSVEEDDAAHPTSRSSAPELAGLLRTLWTGEPGELEAHCATSAGASPRPTRRTRDKIESRFPDREPAATLWV